MKRSNILKYKSFYGSVNCDEEDKILYGKIEFIKDLVNYEAKSIDALITAFHNAVDDYLVDCESIQKEPDKSFKGSFNIRINPDLHQKIGLYAFNHKKTLNSVVKGVLSKFFEEQNLIN